MSLKSSLQFDRGFNDVECEKLGQRSTAKRAAALRQARTAKAARDAERLAREQRIEQALTDFYEATGIAEQIRADAQHRADKILEAAKTKAGQAEAKISRAIRALRDLGQTNADIAELCGITVGAVRMLANDQGGGDARDEGNESSAAGTREEDAAASGAEGDEDAVAGDHGESVIAEGPWQPPVITGDAVGEGVDRYGAGSFSAR